MRTFVKYIITTLFVLFLITAIHAQKHDFIRYGIEDGLAHTVVTDITQDNYGNLWFATQGGGLSKYNGLKFENFTVRDGLPSNYIRKLAVDNNGVVWVATAEGLSRIVSNRVAPIPDKSKQQMSGSINALFTDSKGYLWLSTNKNGIFKLSPSGNYELFDASNGFVNDRVIDITEDAYGHLWIVTVLNGLYRHSEGEFKQVVRVEDIKGYVLSVDAFQDSLWMGTNRGIYLASLKDSSAFKAAKIEALEGAFVKSVVCRESEKWMLAANGLMSYKGGETHLYGDQEGFSSETVLSGFKDREGNLWFGTNGQGVFRYVDARITKFEHKDVVDVRSISKDKEGNYWLATFGNGVYKYNGEEIEPFEMNKAIPGYVTATAIDKQGSLWVGTRSQGIYRYSNGTLKQFRTDNGLANNSIRSFYISADSALWIMTINGVSRFQNRTFTNFTQQEGLLNGVVWNVIEDHGQLLFVTRDGINQWDGEKMTVFDNSPLIFDRRINCIEKQTDDVFWVGYSGYGLSRYNRSTGKLYTITTEHGLISDIIHNIVIINKNELLVATERGIDEVFLDDSGEFLAVNHYANTEKGVGLCNSNPAGFLVERAKVWFGAKGGVFCFDRKEKSDRSIEPVVSIRGVEFLFEQDSLDNGLLTNEAIIPLQIPYDNNSISIAYFGTHIRDAKDVVYKYKLEGFQDDWSPITTSQFASFTNLPPGSYLFKVKARNNFGQWSGNPASISFKVLPPFYLTPWFFALTMVVLLAAARYIYILRVRHKVQKALTVEKIKEDEALRVRKMMARDFHDNMGNQLASITVFTNLISLKLKNSSDEILGLLNNIEKHSKSLYTGTKDFIWSMDPESDYLSEIFMYLKDFGEDLFEGTELQFYSEAGSLEEGNLQLPSGWSRQIVLIFKEAMTNALKYSKATKVELSANLNSNQFVLSFKDNGKGFDIEKAKSGNGLRNMQQRAKTLRAQFQLNQLSQGGIEIKLIGLIEKPKSKSIKLL